MNIYICAPWLDKDLMPDRAKLFVDKGHVITHKWWEVENLEEVERDPTSLKMQALDDWNGVYMADALVLFNTSKSEGKAVEQGLAIALDKPIIAIGKLGEFSKNVFHYLDEHYKWVATVEEALEVLSGN